MIQPGPLFAFVVERPEGEQLVVSQSRVFHAALGAALAAALISIFYSDPAVGPGALLLAIPLWYCLRSLYIAIAGWSYCFDSSQRLVFKNGQRLVNFAGIKSVLVAVRFRPSVNPFFSKYTISFG